MQSLPKKRPCRPPGAKNKHSKQKPCPKSEMMWNFGKSRKRGKKGKHTNARKESKLIPVAVDDKENTPSQEIIAEFNEKGTVTGDTQKSRKV